MDKYQNKYLIPSTRLQSWNYGWDGTYFITICVQDKVCCFGEIMQAIQLSPLGQQAYQCALDIPLHFPFVVLDEFVIMPNHVHLLFTIHKTDKNTPADAVVQTQNFASKNNNTNNDKQIQTQNFASLPPPPSPTQPQNQFGPQSKNVASIIRGFKIGVTKFARNNAIDFKWQRGFHDHIVRSPEEFERIRYYIQTNVENWENDTLNGKDAKFCVSTKKI